MANLPEITEKLILQSIINAEARYRSIKAFPLIQESRELINALPTPSSYGYNGGPPLYYYQGCVYSIGDVISPAYEPLSKIVDLMAKRYPILQGKDERESLMRGLLLSRTSMWVPPQFGDFHQGTDALRKWETDKYRKKLKKMVHQIMVQQLLPLNAPISAHLTLSTHDLIEESKRHRILEKLLLGEELLPSEEKFVNDNSNIYGEFEKVDKQLAYERGVQAIINLAVEYLRTSQTTATEVESSLSRMTRRANVLYGRSIQSFGNETELLWKFWHILYKGKDRGDNGHFVPTFLDDTEVFQKRIFYDDATKLFSDLLKNSGVIERTKDTYLDIRDELVDKPQSHCYEDEYSRIEFLESLFGLAGLNNMNANRLMRGMIEFYGNEPLTIELQGKPVTQTFTEWVKHIYKKLYIYSEHEGGFDFMDEFTRDTREISYPAGSLKLYSKFLEEKMSFFKLIHNNPEQIYLLYQGAAINKLIALRHLSHRGWVNGELIIYPNNNDPLELSTMGPYDDELNDYEIKMWMDTQLESQVRN